MADKWWVEIHIHASPKQLFHWYNWNLATTLSLKSKPTIQSLNMSQSLLLTAKHNNHIVILLKLANFQTANLPNQFKDVTAVQKFRLDMYAWLSSTTA